MSSNSHDSHDSHEDYDVHVHVSTTKLNVGVLMTLFALTGLTLACYLIRLGDANLTVALMIATIKMVLVATFFMHLSHEKSFNTLFFVGAFAFVGVFFYFTYNDTSHRGETDYRDGMAYDYRAHEWAQGVSSAIRERHGELLLSETHAAAAAEAPAAPAAPAAAAPAPAPAAPAAPAAEAPAPAAPAAPAPAAPAPAAPAAPTEGAAH